MATHSIILAWKISWTEEPGGAWGCKVRRNLATKQQQCGVLDPRPGIEPASPALQGRFLINGPLGKSQVWPSFFSSADSGINTHATSFLRLFTLI